MKVLQINTVCGIGSTGRIAVDLQRLLEKQGHEGLIAYGRGEAPADIRAYRIGSDAAVYRHVLKTRLTDRHGFGSQRATRALIREIEAYAPDVIHLHNVHGYYLHIGELFTYLAGVGKPVVWTLHDCWPITGHCAHFEYSGCERWKTGCHDCPERTRYPSSLVDASARNYPDKKALFSAVPALMLVTPSAWLAAVVQQSFLGDRPVEVIPNGIDHNVFHPKGDRLYDRYGAGGLLLLSVANIWDQHKGLSYLIELSHRLRREDRLVVVGVTEKQQHGLPDNLTAIPRTDSPAELAALYSAADAFINPTLEDTFPTVNLEALACGTPVITFRTGGSVETVDDRTGAVVDKGDVAGLCAALEAVRRGAFKREDCVARAAALYDKDINFQRYIALYERLCSS